MYPRLTVFLTEGKRVFHVSNLSLDFSGNEYASDRISYRQTSTYRPHHMQYVTVVVFVCPYVRTVLEWDHLWNSYIGQQTHTKPSHQNRIGTTFYKQEPKLKVYIEELPTTNYNMKNCPIYKRHESMPPDNVHQHAIKKTLQTIDSIKETTTF